MDDINSSSHSVHQNEASICSMHENISSSAQSPVTSKSFYQTLCGYFATAKIFVYPDIEIVQEGDKIGLISYTEGEGRSKIKINLPVNAMLEYFIKTENRTAFKAFFGYVAGVSRNSRKRDSNQNTALQFSNKSCQTETDNLNRKHGECLKMNEQLSDLKHTGDCYSLIEGNQEHGGTFYRGLTVDEKSHSKKKIVFGGHEAILESVTFTTDATLQERDTCILFRWQKDLYSPSAIWKILTEKETVGDSFDIILLSEREGQLRIEILSDVLNNTAFQVAKNLQNLKNGCNVRKLKDVLRLPDSGEQEKQPSDLWINMNTQQKRLERHERKNINKETADSQKSKYMKEPNDEEYSYSQIDEYKEKIIFIQKTIVSKNLQKIDLSKTNSYCENLDLEKTKTKVPSHRIAPTKMRKSKTKTQTKHPEWKIYLRHGEDELRNLVSDYFGDNMIRQAVYGMLGTEVDRYKASFERPNVPWPSMHPLLPYKLRFLDEDEDHNHTLSDPFTGDLYNQQNGDSSTVTEPVDSCEQSDCSNVK